MYLIDSILKNVREDYIELFKHNIISIFTYVFEKSDEKTRKKLYELRHTWNDVFAKSKLYMLDTKVQQVDPAWPVAAGAAPSTAPVSSKPNIHINPNMIKGASRPLSKGEKDLKDLKDLEILKREEEILELQKKRILLEQKKKQRETRSQKTEAEAKPEPAKPVTKPAADPSINADKRAAFLRSYKIKKNPPAQAKEDAKVSSTIHVDPRRVHQVLPQVAASVPVPSRDPRVESSSSRDPRMKPEKTSRDPRMPPENTRDPRLKSESSKAKPDPPKAKADITKPKVEGSRDPRLTTSVATNVTPPVVPQPKAVEQQVTSSRDPRVVHKEPEKIQESSKSKKEKEKEPSPSKRKKSQKSETKEVREPQMRETRSSKSASSSSSREKDVLKAKPAEVPPPPPTAKFKRKTRQRTYKHREDSPDEKNLSQSSSSSSGKRSRGDRSSSSNDSEDSDHYVGNVPNKSQPKHSSKKSKKPDSRTPVIADTDYRHFNPAKQSSTTNENISPPKKDKIMDEESIEPPQGLGLFSNQDVDYRQILPRPMPVIPPPSMPPSVPATFSVKDQDDRKPSGRDVSSRDPLASISPPDNQDHALDKGEMGPPDSMNTPSRSHELRMRKPSFNSPHAASWEKFREKNPEFKEYTRQASISESERNHSLDEDEVEFGEEAAHGFPVHLRNMNHPFKHDRKHLFDEGKPPYDEDLDAMDSPRYEEASREHYKVILSQAEEQRRRGEINMAQYNQLLTAVVKLLEEDKIQQVLDLDRHRMRTPQPQMPGSGDVPGDEKPGDVFGPSNVPSSGPGRPPPLGVQQGAGHPHGHTGGRPGMPPHPGHPGGPPHGHPGGPGFPIPGPGEPSGHGRGHAVGESFGRGGPGTFRNDIPVGPRGGGMIGGRGGGSGRGGPPLDSDDGWGRGGRRERGGRRGRGVAKGGRWGPNEMMEDEWIGEPELPFLPDDYLHIVDRDNVTRKIEIDGVKRDVRIYGPTAIVFLEWDDPRVLSFSEGQVTAIFDGGEYHLPLRIGEDYKEFTFHGKSHRVKLGPPSQELMLDDVGYQCLIGGSPITVHYDGAAHTIALEGKPPRVDISPVRNTEYVVGVIQLVIQAQKFVQLFLDARPQRFSIDGRAFVIKFVDSFKAVTINNQKFPVEFGGLPLSICVRGYRRFLSFGQLPQGVIPGQIAIRGMEIESANAPRGLDNPGNVPAIRPPGQIPPAFDMPHQGSPGPVPNNLRPPGPISQGPHPQGPIHRGPIPQGPIHRGPIPQGPIPQGPIHQGPIPRGPMPQGPIHQGPHPQGHIPQGAPQQGPPIQMPVLHGPPQPPTLKEPQHMGSPNHPGHGFPGPPHPAVSVATGPGPVPMTGPGPVPMTSVPPQQSAPVQGMPQPTPSVQGMPQPTPTVQGMPQSAPSMQGMPPQVGPMQGMPKPGAPVPVQGVPPQHVPVSRESQMPPGPQPQGGGPPILPKPPVTLQGPHPPPVPPVMPGPHVFPSFMNQPPPPIGTPHVPPAIHVSYTTSELPPPPEVGKPPPVSNMPIDTLLFNLQRIGMIGQKGKNKEEEQKEEEEEEDKEREADERIPIELMLRLDNLRKRRKWVIESVYRGMQCSSCGLRYPPEQTVQYSHHLDWHFRKNKKQQESTKKANTRKFYFSIDDWLQYEEIEDLEERVPCMFETEGLEESMDMDEEDAPSVPVTSGVVPEGSSHSLDVCPTCLDKFHCFFHQETEEWRYRNAMQVDGLNYHPACHQDNLRAEEAAKLEAEREAAEKEAAEKEAAEKEAADKEAAEKESTEKEAAENIDKEADKDAVMEDAEKEKPTEKDKEGKGGEVDANMDADTQNLDEEATQDVPMESQPSVTTKLDQLSLASSLPVRIKEEPMDVVEEPAVFVPPVVPDPPVVIKKEIKKEPEEQNEDELIRVPEEDDEDLTLENDENEWNSQPVAVNAAETDIASSIDGNTELSSTGASEPNAGKAKIVFNVSKPVSAPSNNDVNNTSEKNNDHNSNIVNEDEYEEFIPPPFTVDYERKPAFKGVELIDQPVAPRGIELSGLCSIM